MEVSGLVWSCFIALTLCHTPCCWLKTAHHGPCSAYPDKPGSEACCKYVNDYASFVRILCGVLPCEALATFRINRSCRSRVGQVQFGRMPAETCRFLRCLQGQLCVWHPPAAWLSLSGREYCAAYHSDGSSCMRLTTAIPQATNMTCNICVCFYLQWHRLPLRLDQEGPPGASAGLPGVSHHWTCLPGICLHEQMSMCYRHACEPGIFNMLAAFELFQAVVLHM